MRKIQKEQTGFPPKLKWPGIFYGALSVVGSALMQKFPTVATLILIGAFLIASFAGFMWLRKMSGQKAHLIFAFCFGMAVFLPVVIYFGYFYFFNNKSQEDKPPVTVNVFPNDKNMEKSVNSLIIDYAVEISPGPPTPIPINTPVARKYTNFHVRDITNKSPQGGTFYLYQDGKIIWRAYLAPAGGSRGNQLFRDKSGKSIYSYLPAEHGVSFDLNSTFEISDDPKY
jgi:hypothetical protein